MPSAFSLRNQIEAVLAHRIPSAVSPAAQVLRPVMPTGIQALDNVLGGGLPAGAIAEMVGPQCSGRTTMAMACLSAITRTGSVCAWIDVADALDPEAAAANGIDLERLLWVRCGAGERASSRATPEAYIGVSSSVVTSTSQPRQTGGGSPHSRSEGRR
jgi:recombination protein RecA